MRGLAVVFGLAAMAFAAGALTACGLTPYAKAHVALSTAAQIGDAADKAITNYDRVLQDEALNEAEANRSTAMARAKLAEWRPKRAKARSIEQIFLAGLIGFQEALQIAENRKDGRQFDIAGFLLGLQDLAKQLISGLRGLGVEVPKIGIGGL